MREAPFRWLLGGISVADVSAPGVIVGLGNPGREYRETRHNAGFMLVDILAGRWGGKWRAESKFFAEVADVTFADRRWTLVKPQTYMNRSGEAVGKVTRFYQVAPNGTLVLVDDADLTLGAIRLRSGGSPGGHHGLESVEQFLGTREYPRLRLGVARPQQDTRDIANHVLGRFSSEEQSVWARVLERAVSQVECWVTDGIGKAMSLYNGAVE